ncbi:MAG: hypothetical protein O9262_04040 [Cyclobacteriaceae bacterium]|nr:hypothetical protein [Cyclobacteriaceae bacterium]
MVLDAFIVIATLDFNSLFQSLHPEECPFHAGFQMTMCDMTVQLH